MILKYHYTATKNDRKGLDEKINTSNNTSEIFSIFISLWLYDMKDVFSENTLIALDWFFYSDTLSRKEKVIVLNNAKNNVLKSFSLSENQKTELIVLNSFILISERFIDLKSKIIS